MVARPYIAAVALVAGLAGSGLAIAGLDGNAAASKKGVRIVSAYSDDADRDGSVDRVYATFSRAVKGRPRASAFSVKGYRVTGKPGVKGRRVTLRVVERPACDLGLAPAVRFGGRGLKSGGRPVRPSRIDMSRRAGGFPRITCAETADADRNGRLDSLLVTYSKNVSNRGLASGGGPFGVEGYAVTSVGKARGRSLTLRVRERSAPDTGSRPAVIYKKPRRRSPFAVRSGRTEAFSGTFKAVRDRIVPSLVGARTSDSDGNGGLDGITTTWTEPVFNPRGFAPAGARVTEAVPRDETVDLRLAGGSLDTGSRPEVSYPTGAVRDESGNSSAAGSVSPADGAAPVLVAARTADGAGAPGRLDTVAATFSEPVGHPADSDGRYPFSVGGYEITGAGGASGATVNLSLSERSEPDTGARPSVTYSRGQGALVADAAGNEATNRAFGGTTDGVAPRLLSATTLDGDGNGRLDAVRFEFSEPVNHAAESGGGPFSATGLSPSTSRAANGRLVDLALAEAGSPNTGTRPGASYSPDGANDVTDAAGNLAPGASLLAASDGAAPVLVSASTADANPRDGRLDRIAVGFSENVTHDPDPSGPFSFDAAGRSLTAAGQAVGPNLQLELQQLSAPDTGDAPTVSYTGAGTPVVDDSGNTPAARSYPGLTRDAVAPRLESLRTGDADANGRIDRVDARYSETVTGSTGFDVPGRTFEPATATGDLIRVALTEAAGPDTAAQPRVTYDQGAGNVADQAEGPGDAPSGADTFDRPSTDGAGPVIVAARTEDTVAQAGTLDSVRARFSEPVAHPADTTTPFALLVSERDEESVSAPTGTQQDELLVRVTEASAPDGGLRPSVEVVAGGGVLDRAQSPNEAVAKTLPESQTADGVRPVLVSGELGEAESGSCRRSPAENGKVDCVNARFSEPISAPAGTASQSPLTLDNFTVSGFPDVAGSDTIGLPLAEGGAADRDRGARVTYTPPSGQDIKLIEDPSGNDALGTSVQAARACTDLVNDGSADEDNDTRLSAASVSLIEPSLQRRCAFDDDWYSLSTTPATGTRLRASVRPAAGVDPRIELYDGSSSQPLATANSGSAGQTELLEVNVSNDEAEYFVRVFTADSAEGAYCMALSNDDQEPGCGPLAGELVLTEGRFEGAPGEKFLELKNTSEDAIETSTADLALRLGPESAPITTCELSVPPEDQAILDPNEYAVITDAGGPGPFRCAGLDGLPAGGTQVLLSAEGAPTVDSVDFRGLLNTPLTAGHSLELKTTLEDSSSNDNVLNNWCRTWGPDTRGAMGDGCDEYRVNEILFDPVPSGPDGRDGRPFVEIAGNLPAKPVTEGASNLLGGWILNGASGSDGEGLAEFVLPANASPRENGLFVVADAVNGTSRTNLAPGSWDTLWDGLNLREPSWPNPSNATLGPKGLQLLRPGSPANTSECRGALVDAIGWKQTGDDFTQSSDDRRNCALLEEFPVASGVTVGPSAARDNLSSPGDTSYNSANDTDRNSRDFCFQATPNPGQLNVRPPCS